MTENLKELLEVELYFFFFFFLNVSQVSIYTCFPQKYLSVFPTKFVKIGRVFIQLDHKWSEWQSKKECVLVHIYTNETKLQHVSGSIS